jgi:hypothetical protein
MSTALPVRFRDDRTTLWNFADEILAVCPRCTGTARVVHRPGTTPTTRQFLGPRRLVCPACGYTRDQDGFRASFPGQSRSTVTDPFFSVALWLQLPARHGVLWAYNLRHLAFIERFVAAQIRERAAWYDTGHKMTMVAKLPAWLKHLWRTLVEAAGTPPGYTARVCPRGDEAATDLFAQLT